MMESKSEPLKQASVGADASAYLEPEGLKDMLVQSSSVDSSNSSNSSNSSSHEVQSVQPEQAQQNRKDSAATRLPSSQNHDMESQAVEQTAKLNLAQKELARSLPDIWSPFLIPAFFTIAFFTTNFAFGLRHGWTAVTPPATVNLILTSFIFYSVLGTITMAVAKLKEAKLKLFVQKDRETDLALSLIRTANNEGYQSLNRFIMPASKKLDFKGFFVGMCFGLLAAFGFSACSPLCGSLSKHFSSDPVLGAYLANLMAGLIETLLVFGLAKFFDWQSKQIKTAYFFAARTPVLKRVLRFDFEQKNDRDVILDFDAFADIQRWFKHRFSQKSWKKTTFIVVLVLAFICFDGMSLLLNSITYLTGLLTSNAVLSAGGGAQAGAAMGGGLHLFSNIINLLVLGGFWAFCYASYQPTHLEISENGIAFLFKRKRFGSQKIKRVAWKDIQELRLSARKGTTLVGDKELRFEGRNGTLLKFKLNCIESVSSREKILLSIEKWAPKLSRDADIIQILQRPAEQSYTDLWLQTLASPPKRDRLKPLVANSVLQDNRYAILRALGVGGQGTAYLAKDSQLSRTVVLKEFILPVYVDISVRKSALERFENEARILQKLNHEQIVKLTDFFVEDHRGYLALEYIQGLDLKKFVEQNGKLSEDLIVPLALQMCAILQYLHGQDPPVIHRDFTPDNLILQPDGKLMLIDFNVAQQTNATVTGTIVGKQCYLPPEQFQGDPVVQSDIYSMGATIFFLCTGEDPEPISRSRPTSVDATIGTDLDMFVFKATTIDPELRPNAAACIEELEQMKYVDQLESN